MELLKKSPQIYLYGVNKGYGFGINGLCEEEDKGSYFQSLALDCSFHFLIY